MANRPGRNAVLRQSLLFTIALLFICQAAAATVVHDTWTLVGNPITVADRVIQTAVDDSWEKLLLTGPEESYIITKGDCKQSKFYQYCYIDNRYELDVYGEWNIYTLKATPEIHVKITDISPLVSITGVVSPTSIAVNEEAIMTVTVKNTGDLGATSLIYEDTLPDNAIVMRTSMGVSTSMARKVTWDGKSLRGGETKTFSYTFKLIEPEDFKLGGNLTYIYNDQEYTKSMAQSTVTAIKEKMTISTFALSATTASINDEITLTAKIGNADQNFDAKVINFKILVPADLTIMETDSKLSGSGRAFTWSGTIAPLNNKTFEIKVRTQKSGTYEFTADLESDVQSVLGQFYRENASKESTLNVNLGKLTPTVTFRLNKNTLSGGEESAARFYLQNADHDISYFDIEYGIESELFYDISDTIRFITPDEKRLILIQDFKAPVLQNAKTFPITFTGKYRTENYEYFTFTLTPSVSVSKETFEQILDLNLSLPAEIIAGTDADVSLRVKNIKTNDVTGVKLTDTLTGAEVTSGTPSTTISAIGANATTIAYRYTFRVPEGSTDSEVLINTKVEFTYRGQPVIIYTEKAASIVAVATPEPIEPGTPPGETPTEPGEPEPQPPEPEPPEDEEESAFKRFINSIVDFFSSIF